MLNKKEEDQTRRTSLASLSVLGLSRIGFGTRVQQSRFKRLALFCFFLIFFFNFN
jgi:hypothetical protein